MGDGWALLWLYCVLIDDADRSSPLIDGGRVSTSIDESDEEPGSDRCKDVVGWAALSDRCWSSLSSSEGSVGVSVEIWNLGDS